MPSLERFFDPQMRKFDANVRPLPGARLYFFESGTTTPQTVFQDKQGETPHTNPVIADSTGVFPQIFLDNRLYRAELRSSANIVQPGWPIDNIGQDSPIVPFGPWSEIVTYTEGEVVTAPNGNWYRSIGNGNLGNEPSVSPTEWEVIPIPVSSSFTSDAAWITFSDDGDQISLDVDVEAMVLDALPDISANLVGVDGDFDVGNDLTVTGDVTAVTFISATDQPDITLTLLNGYTGSSALKSRVKDGILYIYGQVLSAGSITGTTPYNPIATLPVGYRPSAEVVHTCMQRIVADPFTPDLAYIRISTNGTIAWSDAQTNKIVNFAIAVPL